MRIGIGPDDSDSTMNGCTQLLTKAWFWKLKAVCDIVKEKCLQQRQRRHWTRHVLSSSRFSANNKKYLQSSVHHKRNNKTVSSYLKKIKLNRPNPGFHKFMIPQPPKIIIHLHDLHPPPPHYIPDAVRNDERKIACCLLPVTEWVDRATLPGALNIW